MKREVLGIKIDDISQEQVLETIAGWFSKEKKTKGKLILTPGPEFILTAQKDQEFKKILNSADLSIAESFGLQLYCGFTNRVPGVDLMFVLCNLAQENNWTIGMLGNPNTGQAAKELYRLFPKLKIIYALDNPEADRLIRDYDTLRYVDILFVGTGHPKQEKFLWKIKNFKKFKVGIGVGGSFDMISGKRKRAPEIFKKIGLEWLWRLVIEPKRFRKSFNAGVIFPITYLISKFS